MADSVQQEREAAKEALANVLSTSLQLHEAHEQFIAPLIKNAVSKPDTDRLKSSLELAFRDVLFDLARIDVTPTNFDQVARILDMALYATNQGHLADVVMLLLQDLLDCVTVPSCELIFDYLESRAAQLTENMLPNKGRGLALLRLTNELLRRLSKTRHSVFAGRIRLFLARAFPLCEPSGVNLTGTFNVDNFTVVDPVDESEKAQEPELMETTTLPTEATSETSDGGVADKDKKPIAEAIKTDTYEFYQLFWEMQKVFVNPRACLEPALWSKGALNIEKVLSSLEELPLVQSSASYSSQKITSLDQDDESLFSPKYLSSRKLLHLQLQDTHFLRQVLVQILIVAKFWDLYTAVQRAQLANISNKSVIQPNITLTTEQEQKLLAINLRVITILQKLPPDGKTFTAMILHELDREKNWVKWKNDSCPSFEKPPADKEIFVPSKRKRINVGENTKFDLGTEELSRLFNIAPNTDAFIAQSQRHAVPTADSYIDRLKMELDPANAIEQEYRSTHNPTWVWRCLRLISRSMLDKMQGVPQIEIDNGVKLPNLEEFLKNLQGGGLTTPSQKRKSVGTTPAAAGAENANTPSEAEARPSDQQQPTEPNKEPDQISQQSSPLHQHNIPSSSYLSAFSEPESEVQAQPAEAEVEEGEAEPEPEPELEQEKTNGSVDDAQGAPVDNTEPEEEGELHDSSMDTNA